MIAAVVSAIAALLAWKASDFQARKKEIREATSALIGAIHQLALDSRDPQRDNMSDRARTYQVSVFFELAAGPRLDQKRFNAAINWILKASGFRHDFQSSKQLGNHYNTFIDHLVAEATESLRTFDRSHGKLDISEDLAHRFGKVYNDMYYRQDRNMEETLRSEGDYLKMLLRT